MPDGSRLMALVHDLSMAWLGHGLVVVRKETRGHRTGGNSADVRAPLSGPWPDQCMAMPCPGHGRGP